MSRASLPDGAGPGSSISLAPETIKIRNALIEKFTDKPLEEMNQFMQTALDHEGNELRRLGIIAARIFLLRNRVANLQEFNRNQSLTKIADINPATLDLGQGVFSDQADQVAADDDAANAWARLQMTEAGEVNGVRFLPGAIIDAKPIDAQKLVQSGKAIYIDEDGNQIDGPDVSQDHAEIADDAAHPTASDLLPQVDGSADTEGNAAVASDATTDDTTPEDATTDNALATATDNDSDPGAAEPDAAEHEEAGAATPDSAPSDSETADSNDPKGSA